VKSQNHNTKRNEYLIQICFLELWRRRTKRKNVIHLESLPIENMIGRRLSDDVGKAD